jgi:hypothetical protein
VNFVPRWIIIVILVGIYVHLFFIIRKAHTGTFTDEEEVSVITGVPLKRLTTSTHKLEGRKSHTIVSDLPFEFQDFGHSIPVRIRRESKALQRVCALYPVELGRC